MLLQAIKQYSKNPDLSVGVSNSLVSIDALPNCLPDLCTLQRFCERGFTCLQKSNEQYPGQDSMYGNLAGHHLTSLSGFLVTLILFKSFPRPLLLGSAFSQLPWRLPVSACAQLVDHYDLSWTERTTRTWASYLPSLTILILIQSPSTMSWPYPHSIAYTNS